MLDNTETNKIEKLEDLSQTENKTLKELKAKRITAFIQLKELEIKKKGYEYHLNFMVKGKI